MALIPNQSAHEELSRFFAIAADAENISMMKMPRCAVDALWHVYMTNPTQYIRFSAQHAGVYFEHMPGNGHEEMQWVPEYERRYGRLSRIWFTDASGAVDEAACSDYVSRGKMIASWDCGPIVPEVSRKIQIEIESLKKVIEINRKIDILKDIPLPGTEQIEKIDDTTLIDSIKDKIDRFNIEEIKKKYPPKP